MTTELAKFRDSLSETSDPNVCQKDRPKFGQTKILVDPYLSDISRQRIIAMVNDYHAPIWVKYGQFIWSAKISKPYFSIKYANCIVCLSKQRHCLCKL